MLSDKFIDEDKINIYLAGPMDKGEGPWREKFKSNKKVNYVNPADWGYDVVKDAKDLVENDLNAIKKCDIIFVYAPMLSVGTSMELVYAEQFNKRIVAVIPSRLISPWHLYHIWHRPDNNLVNSFSEGKKVLNKFIKELEIEK